MTIQVDWEHGAAHMWANHKVTVAEANEAVADIDAVWFDPDPNSRSGQSVRGCWLLLQQAGDLNCDPGPPG